MRRMLRISLIEKERPRHLAACLTTSLSEAIREKQMKFMEPILTDVPFLVKSQNETYIKVCS